MKKVYCFALSLIWLACCGCVNTYSWYTDEYLYNATWYSETNDITFTIGAEEDKSEFGYSGTMNIDGEDVPITVFLISPGTRISIALQSAGDTIEDIDEFIVSGSYKQHKDKLTFEVYKYDNTYFDGDDDIKQICFARN